MQNACQSIRSGEGLIAKSMKSKLQVGIAIMCRPKDSFLGLGLRNPLDDAPPKKSGRNRQPKVRDHHSSWAKSLGEYEKQNHFLSINRPWKSRSWLINRI